jgi:hypothetical protein
MRYELLFCTKWPYIITAVVSCCVVISEIVDLIMVFRRCSVFPRSMLPCTISFTLISCWTLYFSVSGVRKIHSIEKDGGYLIEIPENIFHDNNDFSRHRALVSSFKIYSEGLISFDYTPPAEKIGTKYQYNDPAEYPAESRIYKGYYNRIYSIKEGRYLLSGDLEKYVVKELYSEEQDK